MNWTAILPWGAGALALLVVFGWVLNRSQEPGRLAVKWLITAIAIGGIWLLFANAFKPAGGFLGGIGAAFMLGIGSAVFGLVLAIVWTRSLISWLTGPLQRLFYDDHQEIEPAPLYSQAQALRKRGNYMAALAEVEHQLEQFPNDLTGTLLLAEIHAVDLHHLENAERILEHFMRNTSVGNSVVALNQMADWRLGLGQDLHGAREALERIRKLCPDTEAAYMASQRLAHLDDPERFQELHTLQPPTVVCGSPVLMASGHHSTFTQKRSSPYPKLPSSSGTSNSIPRTSRHGNVWRRSMPSASSEWTWRAGNWNS